MVGKTNIYHEVILKLLFFGMKTFLFSFLLIVTISCAPEKAAEPTVFSIEATLKPFVASFLKEAKARNVKIDTTNLILKLNTTAVTDKCGTCMQSNNKGSSQKTVEIFNNVVTCWQLATYNGKEALVFHELGHCLLNRIEHKDDKFANGSPKSIMVSANTDLYTPCVYVIDGNVDACNKTARRKYYIDELFDPKTPTPSWAN
jgi:hypothetical protein